VSDEVTSTSQIRWQSAVKITFNLILDRPVEEMIRAEDELLAVHPSLSAYVASIVDASEVVRQLESRRNVGRCDAVLREHFEHGSFLIRRCFGVFNISEYIESITDLERVITDLERERDQCP
jgi:hypothetical protein